LLYCCCKNMKIYYLVCNLLCKWTFLVHWLKNIREYLKLWFHPSKTWTRILPPYILYPEHNIYSNLSVL
jgi:hypothetical protein